MQRVGWSFAAVFLLYSSSALAQLNVGGPGLALVAPLRVVANAPAQPTIAHFVFENTSDAEITLTPSVRCPLQTVSVALIDVAIDVPAGERRLIQVRFADPRGGAQAGDEVECLLFTGVLQLTLFVQLVAPAGPPPLGSLSADLMLVPEGVQTEAARFVIDATSNLRLNVSLSGLMLGADVGWGGDRAGVRGVGPEGLFRCARRA